MADCDLCGGGFGCAGRGPVEERRWIQGATEGDNLITALYLLSSSSSTLTGSLSLSPSSRRYGNLKPGKKPSALNGDMMVRDEMERVENEGILPLSQSQFYWQKRQMAPGSRGRDREENCCHWI